MDPRRLVMRASRPLRALKGLGPGSVSTVLNTALSFAYWSMMLLTALMLAAFLAAAVIPMDTFHELLGDTHFQVGEGENARLAPVTRLILLFGIGSFAAYFGGFTVILGILRRIFRTLSMGDPFQPQNVTRLRRVGLILAIVAGGVWAWQLTVSRLSDGGLGAPNMFDLLTPVFSVLVVFVLAEVFREGARLRRESELTI